MATTKYIKPTESELEILQILWQKGSCTVRDVHEELSLNKDAGYTTTLKLMQIMTDKGILVRDESSMKHIYQPAQPEEKIKSQLLNRFVDSLYNGSAASLMMQLLGNKKTSKKELDAIRDLLKKFDQEK